MGREHTGRFVRVGAVLIAATMATACSGSQLSTGGSQEFKPSAATMVVAASPGGGSDLMGRTVSAGLEEVEEGLTVSVENHPGGSTAVGYSHLMSKAGDPEYLVAAETTLSALPLAIDTPYHWKDFTPIGQVAEDALVVAVQADSDYDALDALAEGDGLRGGIVAATGPDSVLLHQLEVALGAKYQAVVFESADESNAALLAGNVDFIVNNPAESKAYLESDDMQFLATFTEERLPNPELADVPTATEQGVDVVFAQWRGVLAAGELDEAEAEYWRDALVRWTETDSYASYIEDNDLVSVVRTGDEFSTYLDDYEQVLAESIQKSE